MPHPTPFELFRDGGSTTALNSLFQKSGVKCFISNQLKYKIMYRALPEQSRVQHFWNTQVCHQVLLLWPPWAELFHTSVGAQTPDQPQAGSYANAALHFVDKFKFFFCGQLGFLGWLGFWHMATSSAKSINGKEMPQTISVIYKINYVTFVFPCNFKPILMV